jgi:hypothetical protein
MSATDGTGLAERIAGHGREILLERLRSAFAREAATHESTVELDPVRLEELVQEAAARAGAALWLRSLAQAAMDELGVELAEAVRHPAVAEARELAGAPPYVLAPEPVETDEPSAPPAPPEPPAPEESDEPDQPELQPTELLEVVESEDPAVAEDVPEAPPEPEPEMTLDPIVEPEPAIPAPSPGSPLGEPQALRLAAIHVSGIETLRQGDRDIELRLSEAGLDVLKRSSGAAIGRLEWREIETIHVPPAKRGRRRRGRRLHVSTGRGQAHFELPGLTDEELREHLEPALERLHGGGTG